MSFIKLMKALGLILALLAVIQLAAACEGDDQTAATEKVTAAPLGESGSGTASQGDVGHVVYNVDDQAYRVEARQGGRIENITEALNSQHGFSSVDSPVAISFNGNWLLVNTERMHPDCQGWPCLALATSDLSQITLLQSEGEMIRSSGQMAVASGGNLVIFTMQGGTHELDLFASSRNGDNWSVPVPLTEDSPFNYSDDPKLSADDNKVIFDCGNEPYAQDNTSLCEVSASGGSVRVVLSPGDSPPDLGGSGNLRHPAYAGDESIIFESNWGDSERIWRLQPGEEIPMLVNQEYGNDNSPCVLPNGDIASLWLDRPGGGGVHEIKIMRPDGSYSIVSPPDVDVQDSGIHCGQ